MQKIRLSGYFKDILTIVATILIVNNCILSKMQNMKYHYNEPRK